LSAPSKYQREERELSAVARFREYIHNCRTSLTHGAEFFLRQELPRHNSIQFYTIYAESTATRPITDTAQIIIIIIMILLTQIYIATEK
jgi:hypothetical protein